MNIIKYLTERIEEARSTSKNPCKNYATEEAAEKATAEMAQYAADSLSCTAPGASKSANYVVFYVPAWGRWVGCINLSEVLRRPKTGGYVGVCRGFFTW